MKLATPPRPRHTGRDERGERTADAAVRVAAAITTLYLVTGLWPVWRWSRESGDLLPAALHLAALLAIGVVLALGTRAPRVLRDWLPLALGPFLYVELRWLIPGTGRAHMDATVIGWEHLVFGGDPSATWAPRMPAVPLSELLHLCYASYYLLVVLPPVLHYARGRRADYARTLLALSLVYAACFATYLLFPVDGPRFLVGPAAAPQGPVRDFVLRLLAAGSSRGTAFPSSHVAASVVASLCALRAGRRLGIPVTVLTAGLTLGTVYGGFHYGVDALAGLVVGASTFGISMVLWRRMSSSSAERETGTQSATAAL